VFFVLFWDLCVFAHANASDVFDGNQFALPMIVPVDFVERNVFFFCFEFPFMNHETMDQDQISI
jgi:hypothetical protein